MFGELLGGLLVKITGSFVSPFLLSCVLALTALLYGIFVLQETRVDTTNQPSPGSTETSPFAIFKLDLRREIPWLILLPFFVGDLGLSAIQSLRTFYTNYVFGWTSWEDSLFMSTDGLFASASMILFLPLVERIFRSWYRLTGSSTDEAGEHQPLLLADADTTTITHKRKEYRMKFTQAMFFTSFSALHILLFGLAKQSWELFAIIPLASIGGLQNVVFIALVSEAIDPDHFGLINTLVIQIETLVLVLAGQGFAKVYELTVAEFPPAVFFIASGFYVLAIITFGLVPLPKGPHSSRRAK